jgi:hypothetical protein
MTREERDYIESEGFDPNEVQGGSGGGSSWGTQLGGIFNRAVDVGATYLNPREASKPTRKQQVVQQALPPKTNYTPWIIGGVAALIGLVLMVLMFGRKRTA